VGQHLENSSECMGTKSFPDAVFNRSLLKFEQ
jgi:hypothetical protein